MHNKEKQKQKAKKSNNKITVFHIKIWILLLDHYKEYVVMY